MGVTILKRGVPNMNIMPNTRDLIIRLKEVKEERKLSLDTIEKMTDENGEHVSKTTLSRLFADGSEDIAFRYEATIKPVVNALLDIDTIEDNDSTDVKTMKTVMKFKMERIEELEQRVKDLETALDKQKIKATERLDAERDRYNKSIEFLKEQVAYKDKRMDMLLTSVQEKDQLHKEMLEKILRCSKCEKYEN